MEAYEKGAYSVDDYAWRTAPLKEAEAGLRQTITETSERLEHEAAVLGGPSEILEFTADVAEFIRNSSPKERKNMLQRNGTTKPWNFSETGWRPRGFLVP